MMMNDDETLDLLYKEFLENKELVKLLGNPRSVKLRKMRVRKTITPEEYVTEKTVPFISMHFSSSTETDNAWVVRGFLHIDYYAPSLEHARKMKRVVREIMASKHLRRSSAYDISSDPRGIFHTRDTFRPLLRNDY